MPDGHDTPTSAAQAGLDAIRLDGVRAGRFLPRHDRPAEIKASPIVEDVRAIGRCLLYLGDSTRITPLLDGMHACVTDPPYELGFMGAGWDSSGVAAAWETWGGVRIALRPGGHLVAFAGSRTYHRIAQAIDDAGFEVRDQIMWIYGSGFPKSLDVSKALDKAAGAERRVVGQRRYGKDDSPRSAMVRQAPRGTSDITEAATLEAQRWEGWGTALKPAHEPVCFARKPLSERTVAENVLRWATGALNIDGARVKWLGSQDQAAAQIACQDQNAGRTTYSDFNNGPASLQPYLDKMDGGRWPANVVTDGSMEVIEAFPAAARDSIRFFYAAKADKAEREAGLDDIERLTGEEIKSRKAGSAGTLTAHSGVKNTARANIHPTVKPVDLMRWLCRLVTPPGGIVLDPFMGSGTTGIAATREGFGFVGIEQSRDYYEIACRRVAHAVEFVAREPDLVREITRYLKPQQGTLL